MPPPVTPSPHRFLGTNARRNPSPTKESSSSQPAAYRHSKQNAHLPAQQGQETPARSSRPAFTTNAASPAVASSQFAPTPRFGSGRPKPVAQVVPKPLHPPTAGFVQALLSTRPREDVEDDGSPGKDVGGGDEDEEMLLGAEAGEGEVVPTTELDHDGVQWSATTELPFSTKRRRIQYDETGEQPADEGPNRNESGPRDTRPTFKPPPDPSTLRSHQPSTATEPPRFAPPSTPSHQQSQAPEQGGNAFHNRPAFLRPPLAAPNAQDSNILPLPETFSPHRRGQKFLPGGMASTAQQWIVEAGQAAVLSRRGGGLGYLKDHDVVFRVRVDRVGSEGPPWLLQGREGGGEEVSLLLAGAGHGSGGDVMEGVVVGARAPTWAIELEGRIWQIAVDWRILS